MKAVTSRDISTENLVLPDPTRDHIYGSPSAKGMLLEYGDYQCPYCGAAYPIVKRLQKRLGDKLCFAYRNFPLTNIHPNAQHAAEAAEAADAQGKFWEMHDALFENQSALDDDHIVKYAAMIGLDSERLRADIVSGTYAERVHDDFLAGVRCDVNGTPTFYINGVRYDADPDFDDMLTKLSK